MAAGVVIKHKRKSGAFVNGDLVAGEWGLDVSSGTWYFSRNGTTVEQIQVGGGGDMLKSTYDTNNDGKVNSADSADAVPWAGITGKPTLGTASALNTGTASGDIPVLGSGGKLATSTIPALAMTDVSVVASQAAQLALTAEEGDVAVRSDLTKTYIHNGGSAGTMADWTELSAIGAVSSVNSQTGVVVLTKSDVGLANVANVNQQDAANLTSGNIATDRMTTNVAAALDASSTATIDNSALTLDGGTI